MKKLFYLFLYLLPFTPGCSIFNPTTKDYISIENIKANLNFFASDELEGREATTRGEKLAALFLTTELRKYGVKPFFSLKESAESNPTKSHLQEFELNASTIESSSTLTYISGGGDVVTLKYAEDFFARWDYPETTLKSFNLVFAGYGITSPENNYDDYAKINAKGKIVLLFDGEPKSSNDSYFEGAAETQYSDFNYKKRNAEDHGAEGVLIMTAEKYALYWDEISTFFTQTEYSLADYVNESTDSLLTLFLRPESFAEFFKGQKYSFEDLLERSKNPEKLPVFDINGALNIDLSVVFEKRKSYNIAGVVEGNDPELKDEYIALGAHYDHAGVMNGKIYNGADDNGSGVVALLEIAKALVRSGENKRSVLIVFHAAEEKGLLGSKYLTNNLNIIDNIVVQINMDMVGRESIDTIYSIGSAKMIPSLKKIVEDVNSRTVKFHLNYKFDSPNDPNKFYYRSDHYNYALKKIPTVFFYDYMLQDYHKETDDTDKIIFPKIKKVADLVYSLTIEISNLDYNLKTGEKTEPVKEEIF
jgi:Zn-dependent M28 family amino/carboxypeptidase